MQGQKIIACKRLSLSLSLSSFTTFFQSLQIIQKIVGCLLNLTRGQQSYQELI